uniref:Uncharacterized protein n=1 Tax=Anguilla anguilla TaxID=7936 RepID=A0A0E9U864_ANGAN
MILLLTMLYLTSPCILVIQFLRMHFV